MPKLKEIQKGDEKLLREQESLAGGPALVAVAVAAQVAAPEVAYEPVQKHTVTPGILGWLNYISCKTIGVIILSTLLIFCYVGLPGTSVRCNYSSNNCKLWVLFVSILVEMGCWQWKMVHISICLPLTNIGQWFLLVPEKFLQHEIMITIMSYLDYDCILFLLTWVWLGYCHSFKFTSIEYCSHDCAK